MAITRSRATSQPGASTTDNTTPVTPASSNPPARRNISGELSGLRTHNRLERMPANVMRRIIHPHNLPSADRLKLADLASKTIAPKISQEVRSVNLANLIRERTSPYSQTDFNALLGMDPMLDSYPRSILALPLHLQSEPLDALISQIRLLDDPLEKQQAFGDCYTAVLQLPPEDRSKLLGAFCHQIEHLSANVHAWAWDCLHLANQRLPAAQQDVETSVALSMVLLVLNMSDDERDLRMNLIDPGASERILNEDSD